MYSKSFCTVYFGTLILTYNGETFPRAETTFHIISHTEWDVVKLILGTVFSCRYN